MDPKREVVEDILYSPSVASPRHATGPGDVPTVIASSPSGQKLPPVTLPGEKVQSGPKGSRAAALRAAAGFNKGPSKGGRRADALVSGAAAVGVGKTETHTPLPNIGASGGGPPKPPAINLFAPRSNGMGGRRGSTDSTDSSCSWMTRNTPSESSKQVVLNASPLAANGGGVSSTTNINSRTSSSPSQGLMSERGARVDFGSPARKSPAKKPRDVTWDSVVGTVLGGSAAAADQATKAEKKEKDHGRKPSTTKQARPSDIDAKLRSTPSPDGNESDDDLKESKARRGWFATWWVWCCYFWFCAAGILLGLLLWQLFAQSSAVVDFIIEPVETEAIASRLMASSTTWDSSTRGVGVRSTDASRLGAAASSLDVVSYELKLIGAYISTESSFDVERDVLVYTHPECNGDITTCDISDGDLATGGSVQSVVNSYIDLLEDYSLIQLRLGSSGVSVEHSDTEYSYVHLIMCWENDGGASSLRVSTNETSNIRYVLNDCDPLTVPLEPGLVFSDDVPAGHVVVEFDGSYEAGYVPDPNSADVDSDAYCQGWASSNLCVVGPGWSASGVVIVGGWGDDDGDGGGWSYGGDGDDDVCTPYCGSGWECGSDGCGGSCGTCSDEADICFDGSCCDNTCDFVTCGADSGCGTDCGCADGDVCDGGSCCTPDCEGKVCGDDGCGGVCGDCNSGLGEYCLASQEECCVPDCTGLVCGSDGCDGSCGDCAAGTICYASGLSCSTLYNTVVIGDWRFALLSNYSAEGFGAPCDTLERTLLPSGWSLADNDEESLLAVSLRPWGTWGVVLADGNMYQANLGYTSYLANGRLAGDAVGGYGVTGCASQVLIRQDKNIIQDDQQTLTQPAVNMTNWVTFGGYDYGAIDNSHPAEVENQACQLYFYEMPDGWELAPHADDSVLVIGATGFDTWCMVLADGQSYDRNMEDCGDEQLKSAQGGGALYYGVHSCNRRVMIRRATVDGTNLWEPRPFDGVQDEMWFAPNSGYTFTTMLNQGPFEDEAICQSDPVLVEPGWEYVNSTENYEGILEAATAGRWGTNCIVSANGTSYRTTYDRLLEDCGDDQLEAVSFLTGSTYAKTNSCDRSVLLQSTDGKAELMATRNVQLKTLVVVPSSATDDEKEDLEALMQGWGTDYEIWDREYTPTWTLPSGAVTYSSVIFHSWPLLDSNGNTFWVPEQVADWRRAQATYGLRAVYWNYSSYNLPYQPNGDETTFTDGAASLSWVPSSIVDELGALSGMDMDVVFDVSAPGSYYYENFEGLEIHGNITVLLCESSVPVSTDCASSVAIAAKHETGIEELMFGFPFPGRGSAGSGLLNQVTFTWVTKNLYPGMRRFHLTPMVGSVLLNSTSPEDDSSVLASAGDFGALADWQSSQSANISVRAVLEYHGAQLLGSNVSDPSAGAYNDELLDLLRSNRTEFWFVSAGYSGLSLSCVNGEADWRDCSTGGALDYDTALAEIVDNQLFAAGYLFDDGDWTSHLNSTFAPVEGSGVFNGNALKAWLDSGVLYVNADNSDELVVDDNSHAAHLTTAPLNGYPGVRLVPTYLNSGGVYVGCSTLACNYAQHESVHGTGADTDDLGALKATAQEFANNLMSGHWDPVRFDQANVVETTIDSTQTSLMAYWLDQVLAVFQTYFSSLPVTSFDLESHVDALVQREARSECLASALASYVNGTLSSVSVYSDGSDCTLAVNFPTPFVTLDTDNPLMASVEDFGSLDTTVWMSLNSTVVLATVDLNVTDVSTSPFV